MAAKASIKFDVDPVWAKELMDLPMAVPEYWWLGHTSRKRCFGKIKKVDCKAPNFAYFLLEVNGAPGQLYGMRYDDVLLYADNKNPDYKKYTLPAAPPLHPKHEKSVTAKTGRGRPHQPKKATAAPVVTRPAKRGKKQQRRRKERGGRITRLPRLRRKVAQSLGLWYVYKCNSFLIQYNCNSFLMPHMQLFPPLISGEEIW